jgi:hypothetical protein
MWLIDQLAEARIEEAMRAGEFDDLPGNGQRIPIDPDTLVPEDLRVAYRLLRNAGYAPPEVLLLKEISEVEQLLAGMDSGESRARALKRLNLLRVQLGARAENLGLSVAYSNRVLDRLDGDRRP